jgi:hypothetical protein
MRKKWNKAYITAIAVIVCGLAIAGCSENNGDQAVSDETIADGNDVTEDSAEAVEEEQDGLVSVSEIEVGDIVDFGNYDQDGDLSNGAEALQFIVLDKQEDSLLLLSRLTIDHQPYYPEWAYITWETSSIRSWLNDTFYEEAFSEEEQEQIQEVELTNPDNPRYGTSGGNETTDKIFLLSIDEVKQYLPSYESRKAGITEAYSREDEDDTFSLEGYDHWWLRSPGVALSLAALVSNRGAIYLEGTSLSEDRIGVRPALWVKGDKFVPDPDMADEKILLTEDKSESDQNISEDEKLYQQFLHNEIPAIEISYHSVYGTRQVENCYYEDFSWGWYYREKDPETERIDLDNDGKDELVWNEPSYDGYTVIDARDGKLYILAEGNGTYCRYNVVDGETWISNADTTHQGREWYHLRKFNGNGEVVDQFDLNADFEDNESETYDENSDFSYRGEKITMEEFEELRMRYLGF